MHSRLQGLGLGDGAVDADEERLGDPSYDDDDRPPIDRGLVCVHCVLFFHVGGLPVCVRHYCHSLLQLTAWVIGDFDCILLQI